MRHTRRNRPPLRSRSLGGSRQGATVRRPCGGSCAAPVATVPPTGSGTVRGSDAATVRGDRRQGNRSGRRSRRQDREPFGATVRHTRHNRPPFGSDRRRDRQPCRRSRPKRATTARRGVRAVRTGHGKGQPSRVPCGGSCAAPVAFGSDNPPTDRGQVRSGSGTVRGNRAPHAPQPPAAPFGQVTARGNRPAPLWRFLWQPCRRSHAADRFGDRIGAGFLWQPFGGDRFGTVRGNRAPFGSGGDRIGQATGNRGDRIGATVTPPTGSGTVRRPCGVRTGSGQQATGRQVRTRQPFGVTGDRATDRGDGHAPTGQRIGDRIGNRSGFGQDRGDGHAVPCGGSCGNRAADRIGRGDRIGEPFAVPVAFGRDRGNRRRGDRFGRGNGSGDGHAPHAPQPPAVAFAPFGQVTARGNRPASPVGFPCRPPWQPRRQDRGDGHAADRATGTGGNRSG